MSDDPMLYWESHRQLLMFVWQVMNQCCTEKVTDSCWCLRDRWWTSVVLRKSQTAVDVCVTGDEPVLYWESHRQLLMFAWQVMNQCCTEKVTDSCWCLRDRWWTSVVLRKSQTAVDVCMTGDEPVLYWESHRQLLMFVWQVMNQCCIEKVTDSCWCLCDRWWTSVVLRKSQTAVDVCVTGDEPVLYWESHRQLLMFVWQVMNQCCAEKVTDNCWCLCDRWWTSVVLRKSQTAVDVCVTGDEPVLYWESQIAVSVCMKCDDPVLSWGSQRQLAISVGVTGGNLVSSWKSQRQLSVFAWQVMTQYCIEKVTHSCQCLRDGWWPGVILKKSETAVSICMTGDDPVLYWESHSQLSVFAWWVMTWCHLEKVRDSCQYLHDRWWPSTVLRKSLTAVSVCVMGDDLVSSWKSQRQLAVRVCWQVTTQCCLETVGGRRVSSKGEKHWPVMQGVSSGVLGQAQTWPTGRARHRCVHPPLFTLQLLLPVEKKMLQISPGSNFCTRQSFQHFSQAKYRRAIHAFKIWLHPTAVEKHWEMGWITKAIVSKSCTTSNTENTKSTSFKT